MVEILKLPLFAALVGLVFTVGFAPWLARRWQDLQREREVRSTLVADMSRCIMSLVAVLERLHPGPRRDQSSPSRSVKNQAELDKAILTFEIDRCVIGTRLETYFTSHSLADRWTTFADELTLFSAGWESQNPEERLYRGEDRDFIWERKKAAVEAAAKRSDWVEAGWGETEQLFLGQKLELLTRVRTEPMEKPPRPEGSIGWFMGAVISLVVAALAFIGKDGTDQKNQTPYEVVAWLAIAVAISLLIAALLQRLLRASSTSGARF
jgi:hypothetical protein